MFKVRISIIVPIVTSIIFNLILLLPLQAQLNIPLWNSNPELQQPTAKKLLSFSFDNFENVYQYNLDSGWRSQLNGDELHYIGIQVDLSPGWKTYWRMSGSDGFPMFFDWEETTNLKTTHINWPTPTLSYQDSEPFIGYTNTAIFPVSLYPINEGEIIYAKGELVFGICKEVCIPIYEPIEIILDPQANLPRQKILDALDNQPEQLKFNTAFNQNRCWYEESNKFFDLYVQIRFDDMSIKPPFSSIAEDPTQLLYFHHPEGRQEENGVWQFHSQGDKLNSSGEFDLSKTIFTVVTPDNAYEFTGC